MIVFDLKCNHGHTFEGWFRSSDDFDKQSESDIIACPSCSSVEISKAIMAPNVATKSNQKPSLAKKSEAKPAPMIELNTPTGDGEDITAAIVPDLPQELQDQMEELFAKVQKHVEDNCTYVGEDFSSEARKIHYGESETPNIYGEATEEETLELIEEGIDILPLPIRRKTDA